MFEGFNYFSFFSNENFDLIDNRPDGLSLDRYIVWHVCDHSLVKVSYILIQQEDISEQENR